MVRCPGGSFRWVSLSRPSPLLRESCHPKSEDVREGRPRTAAFTSCFGRALSAGVTRPTAWAGRDDVGLSPVSVVSHFVQATPPDTLTDHRRSPSILRCESTLLLPMLRQMTELGTPPGPNRDASWTISAWPLRQRRLPHAAGCIPLNGFERRFPYGLGPSRVGLDLAIFPIMTKSHRL